MNPNYRGVAFLLSLGSLPIACNDKDPADTPDTADTGNTPPGTDPSGTTTPVDPTTGPDGTSTSTSSTSTSTGPDPSGTSTEDPSTTFLTTITTTAPTTEDTEDTGPPDFPPPTNPECQAYADHVVMCFPRYADYANAIGYYCDQYIMYGMQDGMGCTDAIKALFVCFSTIPCDSMDPEAACMTEQTAIETACPSFGGSETGTADTGSSTG